MIRTWLIILTALPPFAEPKLQEFVSPNCRENIENIRAQETTIMARCEARYAPQKIEAPK